VTWSQNISFLSDFEVFEVNLELRVIADDDRREQPGRPLLLIPEQKQIILYHITEAQGRNSAAEFSSLLASPQLRRGRTNS
jgi:hypothetical protein